MGDEMEELVGEGPEGLHRLGRRLLAKVSDDLDADVFVYNGDIYEPLDMHTYTACSK